MSTLNNQVEGSRCPQNSLSGVLACAELRYYGNGCIVMRANSSSSLEMELKMKKRVRHGRIVAQGFVFLHVCKLVGVS